MEYYDNWRVQVRKGILELCILNILAAREHYGYDLVKTLVATMGKGVTEGTIYPLLSRIRLQGLVSTRLVESSSGPARKYYALTKIGEKTRQRMNAHFQGLIKAVDQLQQKEPDTHGRVD